MSFPLFVPPGSQTEECTGCPWTVALFVVHSRAWGCTKKEVCWDKEVQSRISRISWSWRFFWHWRYPDLLLIIASTLWHYVLARLATAERKHPLLQFASFDPEMVSRGQCLTDFVYQKHLSAFDRKFCTCMLVWRVQCALEDAPSFGKGIYRLRIDARIEEKRLFHKATNYLNPKNIFFIFRWL